MDKKNKGFMYKVSKVLFIICSVYVLLVLYINGYNEFKLKYTYNISADKLLGTPILKDILMGPGSIALDKLQPLMSLQFLIEDAQELKELELSGQDWRLNELIEEYSYLEEMELIGCHFNASKELACKYYDIYKQHNMADVLVITVDSVKSDIDLIKQDKQFTNSVNGYIKAAAIYWLSLFYVIFYPIHLKIDKVLKDKIKKGQDLNG